MVEIATGPVGATVPGPAGDPVVLYQSERTRVLHVSAAGGLGSVVR